MRYLVEGADRKTGEDSVVVVKADNKAQAERKAANDGLLVASSRKLNVGDAAGVLIDCENCGKRIGKLEPVSFHGDHLVCAACKSMLNPAPGETLNYARPMIAEPVSISEQEYRALGLNSRGMAWGIAIVGLLLSPVVVGIPLAVWGIAAACMLAKHEQSVTGKSQPRDGSMNIPGPIAFLIIMLTLAAIGTIFVVARQ